MATFQFEGVDNLIAQYQTLLGMTDEVIGKAVGAGAGVVADAVKAEIRALPVSNQYNSGVVNSTQKKGLIDGFGIAGMRNDNGFLNVKLGFDGYNNHKTKKYPNGQPNSLIARSINSGSSYRKKNPFVDRATRATKSKCESTMENKLNSEIQKLIGG